mmetsp:Transcript_51911/g.57996  ORF Transcript_51911/g.57996 Transcript_51911/m.57996 type:complete len:1231 (-) Transcript_51911:85-3777(-)
MSPAPEDDGETILINETTTLVKENLSNNSLSSLLAKSSESNVRDSMEAQIHYKRTLRMLILGISLSTLILSSILFRPTTSINSDNKIYDDLTNSNDDNVNVDVDDDDDAVPTSNSFPLSLLDPIHDLGLAGHERSIDDPSFPSFYYNDINNDANNKLRKLSSSSGSSGENTSTSNKNQKALPTNAWYQNMIQAPRDDEPSNLQRAYPTPYLVDVVGLIPGLRVHATDIDASDMVMQLSFMEIYGLVIGAAENISLSATNQMKMVYSHKYRVLKTTKLGITLEWDATKMTSNIVRGMSYVTMEYEKQQHAADYSGSVLRPTIASRLELLDPVIIDGTSTTLDCSKANNISKKMRVEKDIELYFHESDYTWMVFFSEPAWIQCSVEDGKTLVQVVDYVNDLKANDNDNDRQDDNCSSSTSDTFIMRAALIDQCTNGMNIISCRKGLGNRLLDEPKKDEYTKLLREHVDTYPGRDTSFSYSFPDSDGVDEKATLFFNWDAMSMSNLCNKNPTTDLLMFAIPHHIDRLQPDVLPDAKRYCKSSLTGPACLVRGGRWDIPQELPTIGFKAKRPPKPQYIPTLAKALSRDIEFKLPDYFKRGAGDTYFSGKYLAKLARILLITEEVHDLCGEHGGRNYLQFCKNSTLPTKNQVEGGIQELRESVEVWINGKAETPFVYDKSWGGVVSCGCYMKGTECTNRYPNCPGFTDPGLNFGNAFYNDHHFHYGYHIFAASVVAHFDKVWAMNNFENVLLLVRDIANPSDDDHFFPMFRHKDWYQGSSWASGIPYPAFLNGKNQESSSEAIAAYEGVALFGQVMNAIWEEEKHQRYAAVSKQIENVGTLLTGTELVSAKRYWHVKNKDDPQRIYPDQYSKNVIGILWQNMAQFGTWFGSAGYLPIGIQLLPLTPISEDRDDLNWVNSIYKPLTYACATDFQCTESGWSILQLAILATVGYAAEAVMKVKELPDESFTNAGGNGQSRSNTIWYLATRPNINSSVPMLRYDKRGKEEVQPKVMYELKDCYLPDTCTDKVLDRQAGEYTCRVRISWMIHEKELPQWEACWNVAGLEFPDICGPCDPGANFVSKQQQKEENNPVSADSSDLQCPSCTQKECDSDLNRCPVYKRTFVCTEGTSKGGCSGELQFWIEEDQCDTWCEMTNCIVLKDEEAKKLTKDGNALSKSSCPPCEPSICYGKLNQCPIHTAPYVCTAGSSKGGCASSPWSLSNSAACTECCELKLDC